MPPLTEEDQRKLESESGPRDRQQQQRSVSEHSRNQQIETDSQEAEIYDFDSLRANLDEYNDEAADDDHLGDLLVEEGDDLNDETFGDDTRKLKEVIGKDFDFAGHTAQFESSKSGNLDRFDNSRISEEEAFFIKQHGSDERPTGTRKLDTWGTSARSVGTANNLIGHRNNDFHGSYLNSSTSFREASPARNVSSIWGGFGESLSPDRPFGSFQGGSGSFPFVRNQQSSFNPSPPPGLSPSQSLGLHQQQQQQQHRMQPVRLEDIEAQLQRGSFHGEYKQDGRVDIDMRNVKSLSEIEAAMLANSRIASGSTLAFQHGQQQQSQQQQLYQNPALRMVGLNSPEALQLLAMKQHEEELAEQLNAQQQLEGRRKAKYDGLMTQYDKDFINRIQLNQIATSDPYLDDFYYQVYTTVRQRPGLPTWSAANDGMRGGRGRREEHGMQRFHQQLQRMVNNAKRHPRQTQVSLEGALGKIASLTVRNPRQVLEVQDKKNNPSPQDGSAVDKMSNGAKHQAPTVNDRRRTLKIVENLYLIVLELEHMRRHGVPVAKAGYEDEHAKAVEKWNQTYAQNAKKLFNALRLMEQPSASPPLIILVLSVAKGQKLVPRIVRHLGADENMKLLSVVVANYSQLNVCHRVIYPGSMVANVEEAKSLKFVTFEEVEHFMNTAAPPLLGLISEASLKMVNDLMKLLMEKNDILTVARTKPGLALLTMLLSRAEILKQGGFASSPEELIEWEQEYIKIFTALQGNFASLFPSLYCLEPAQPNVTDRQLLYSLDDMYVWQFLAAMAVGAATPQQELMVMENRLRIIENVSLAHHNQIPEAQAQHRLSNVNLFLHALGLDSSQVPIPR
ncbi:topoisomerase II-associated protein PAT1-domain-containing protein [Dichotomocladium elegans]|nr:topoisomerase II-associated protein PAT1-domain-containing protein [Dichotomocladium elegans]